MKKEIESELELENKASLPPGQTPDWEPASKVEIEIRYFLFADVKHYSMMPDSAIPHFVSDFLGGVARLLRSGGSGRAAEPLFANTWGDAFLFVFENARTAGNAALAIRDWVDENPFKMDGMRDPLSLRIGMHAGPVYCGGDPVTGRESFHGSHINRAARIEPIAEQGQIYVSLEFAALAEAEGVTDFRCVSQGIADLPKAFGRIPVYRLERVV